MTLPRNLAVAPMKTRPRRMPCKGFTAGNEQRPPMKKSVAFLMLHIGACGCVFLGGCEVMPDAYEGEEVPRLPPPPAPIIVRYQEAARNGIVPTGGGETVPTDYNEFRNSTRYRLTFRTWMDPRLMEQPGEKSIVIELGNRRGQCFVDGRVAMDFPVCTGTSHHGTPTGIFRITEKDVHHFSNLYHCPMPYFMRLTNDGIGMHVGDVFRVPASHGCIRMTREACTALFRALPHGTQVCIRE